MTDKLQIRKGLKFLEEKYNFQSDVKPIKEEHAHSNEKSQLNTRETLKSKLERERLER